jgi:hypothetical protein
VIMLTPRDNLQRFIGDLLLPDSSRSRTPSIVLA